MDRSPELSDAEYRDRQQSRLLALSRRYATHTYYHILHLCIESFLCKFIAYISTYISLSRVLGSCVGRGMLTLETWLPLLAETLPVPELVLSGRCPPSNASMALDTATAIPDLTLCKLSCLSKFTL